MPSPRFIMIPWALLLLALLALGSTAAEEEEESAAEKAAAASVAEPQWQELFAERLAAQKTQLQESKDKGPQDGEDPKKHELWLASQRQLYRVTKLMAAHNDRRLQAEYLKLEYQFDLVDMQWDMEHVGNLLKRLQLEARYQGYKQAIHTLDTWLQAHYPAEADEDPADDDDS